MSDAKFIVGIDLGTTNSILAYTEAETEAREAPDIQILEISQLIGPGAVAAREMLPSFIYMPGEKDIASDALELPWHHDVKQIVGELARNRGAELPQRLISSSKSWLCHAMVDRNQAILPWGSPAEVPKLSPVEASAAILDHIRRAWNHTIARDDESLILERQEIFLTVPASFDAVARELTVKAAAMAQLPDITLLEEPQAAFYAWIVASGDSWREAVRPGDLVLVCDLGGGTSDFSLIRVSDFSGNLELERIAVGNHILDWRRQHGPGFGVCRRKSDGRGRPKVGRLANARALAHLPKCKGENPGVFRRRRRSNFRAGPRQQPDRRHPENGIEPEMSSSRSSWKASSRFASPRAAPRQGRGPVFRKPVWPMKPIRP